MQEKLISGCATDKGTVRNTNQDRVICYTAKTCQGMMAAACVCDGVGSLKRSEIAAEMVTDGITLWFRSVLDKRLAALSETELTEDFEATLRELNELVYERRMWEGIDMGCTMSALLLIDQDYYIFHVGDSRIYLMKDALYQITRDEVTVSESDGLIKKRLANCVGRNREVWINRINGILEPGEALLLGSDGLFKTLKEGELYEQIDGLSTTTETQRLCAELIRTAEHRGERDNISCAIVKRKR